MKNFAAMNLHISLAPETVFHIGPIAITNSLLLGAIGLIVSLGIGFYVAYAVKHGKHNYLVGTFQWMFESLLRQVHEIVPNKELARKIAPLSITIFLFVLINYWLAVLPGVGPITVGGIPLLRGLPADLNFTIGLALITMIAVQFYAIRHLGIFGNASRYLRNPLKDPIGAFEGILELSGEFSRGLALSLRLFGNAFAGEVLLIMVAILSGYLATVTLPIFMAFELFIGFIQAYVFFMLSLIFTALAQEAHSDDHPPVVNAQEAEQLG